MRIRTIAEFAVLLLVVTAIGTTASAEGAGVVASVHFTAAGDYGMTANTNNVLDGIKAQSPDLNIAVGDLSYAATGTEQAFCDLVTSHLGAGFPFELLAGNHESSGQNGNINDFSACLPNQLPGVIGTYGRQYYVDVPAGNPLVRFVMISPNLPFPDGTTWSYAAGSPRYNWTVSAIDGARTAGIPWVVVGMHEPCWSLGQYSCGVGTDLANMLIAKRVDLVLTGHEHLYQRTKQLATGGSCSTVPVNSYNPACVADSDNSLVQGAGTVFATVGTGGVENRTINTTDSEIGDFAAWSGSNVNPGYGFLDVHATTDALSAQFVPVGGATFTDSFTINRGTPPPNQAPTAAFTSSAQGLTANFDASSSQDPDGSISSYAWDFGDGSSGSGVVPQHTYATDGTYQVTLTVTDNNGATGTVTNPVTVSTPQGPVDFVTDTFNRTVTNGLGTADLGGAWSTSGTASNLSVAPQAAAFRLATAGTQLSGWLGATTRTDTDLRLTLSLDKVPTGNGAYLDVVGRRVSQNNEYRARLVMANNGRITVQLTALKGSSSPTAIASAVTLPTSVTYSAGSQINVRMQVTGTGTTTVQLKVWPATATEPTAWQTTATDTTAALQNPGAVGLTAYLSGSVTNPPVGVRLSNLSARPTA